MTPSRKGLYKFCEDCKHKLDINMKYPCKYSHKQVRGLVKYERDFTKCLLLEKKDIGLEKFKEQYLLEYEIDFDDINIK